MRTGRRLSGVIGAYVVTVFVLITLNFLLPHALPGRPLEALSDPRSASYVGDDERRSAVQDYYGLDLPMTAQYRSYLADLAHGDLGTSIRQNVPVTTLIRERLPWTLLLGGSALVMAGLAGTLLGIRSGWRRGTATDRRLMSTIVALEGAPVFFVASGLAFLLAVRLGWMPLGGARTPLAQSWGWARQALDVGQHLILPATVLALQFTGFQYLIMRSSLVAELGSDHLMLGRAKGLPERVVKYRYAARNALLPAVNVLALQTGALLTASIFVETVFSYPGLGRLMAESVGSRDYPTMQGVFLVLTVVVLVANLAADLAIRRLDPRTTQ